METQEFANGSLKKIDTLRWPAMPDPDDRTGSDGLWIWPRSGFRAFEQVSPPSARGEGYLRFPFALVVFDRHQRHILSVVLEQTDYRVLANLTGERVRDLAGKGKGYLSPLSMGLYDADTHDDLGIYEGSCDRETVFPLLAEAVAERLDLWEDTVRRPIG